MRIGEMAKAAKISEYTLRYYGKKGLIRVRWDMPADAAMMKEILNG